MHLSLQMTVIRLAMTTDDTAKRGGRGVVLTEALAKKIARKIELMPDDGIAVSWENVIDLVKASFGIEFRRNVLSQKAWNGRRIIAEAFGDAKVQERGTRHQAMPKYASASTAMIRTRLERLENERIDLAHQLEMALSAKRDKIDLYRLTRLDLRSSVPLAAENPLTSDRPASEGGRGGRKELLNRKLAEKIVLMIKRMPEANTAVTWDNVVSKIKDELGLELRRNVLSQKEWDGRKLIAEGFSQAKALEMELSKQASLGGKAGERASLRTSLGGLEANVRSLKDELAKARLAQLAQFENYQASRPDLRQLVLALDPGKPG